MLYKRNFVQKNTRKFACSAKFRFDQRNDVGFTVKIRNSWNIIDPQGCIPCVILTKFYILLAFPCYLHLHNFIALAQWYLRDVAYSVVIILLLYID